MDTEHTIFIKNKKDRSVYLSSMLSSREDRIRTCDTLVPNQYSTKLSYFPVLKQSKNGALRLRFQMHPRGVEPLTA